ncbi:TRAM domain-containing protein [Halovivax sp.]|uniref:TRAM domain-containing protein n=1 Tax=Halovivax sp. TaxID=1935978 RepID=UPI0025BDB888|nr:RNA-binding protein [Halovivax sp.]
MRDAVDRNLDAIVTHLEGVFEAIRSLLAATVDSPEAALAIGGGLLAAVALATGGRRFRRWWRRRRQIRRSRSSHDRAQAREPPVEIGDVVTAGVQEFSRHHSGERHAVCKVEGFVVFVRDLPEGLAPGDVVRAKVLSYNRGRTSATARYLGRS